MVKNSPQHDRKILPSSPLPTPPKSGGPRRASPRGHTTAALSPNIVKQKQPLPSSKARHSSTSAPNSPMLGNDPAAKKRKPSGGIKASWPISEDVLCPICDDVCTCTAELARDTSTGTASGWSSPIIIKDRSSKPAGASTNTRKTSIKDDKKKKKQTTASKNSSNTNNNKKKAASSSVSPSQEKRIDRKADKMAQLVLSEYYFSVPKDDDDDIVMDHFDSCSSYSDAEGSFSDSAEDDEYDESGYYSSGSSDLDEIIFELSESEDEETTRRMKELLMSKVNSVIGPNAAWMESGDDDSQQQEFNPLYMFDPADANNLVVNLPLPTGAKSKSTSGNDEERCPVAAAAAHLANLTPQVLAAISAASKTLTAATQHYTHNPSVPFSRDGGKQVAFVFETNPAGEESEANGSAALLDEVFDMSRLHGSSPPLNPSGPSLNQFMAKRWDKIPINSFRKRRLSAPRNVLPANAIKQPPPEVEQRFSQLNISNGLDDPEDDLLIIFTPNATNPTTSSKDTMKARERRSTIQLLPDHVNIGREESMQIETEDGVATEEEDAGYYWPLGGDEEFYWLGEHFRV